MEMSTKMPGLQSYAHDDATHVDRVRKFCLLLRSNGIDARMDLPAGEQRQNWPQWMTHEVRAAEWVLVIASREYKRRAEGEAGPAEGRGVQWEALQSKSAFMLISILACGKWYR